MQIIQLSKTMQIVNGIVNCTFHNLGIFRTRILFAEEINGTI